MGTIKRNYPVLIKLSFTFFTILLLFILITFVQSCQKPRYNEAETKVNNEKEKNNFRMALKNAGPVIKEKMQSRLNQNYQKLKLKNLSADVTNLESVKTNLMAMAANDFVNEVKSPALLLLKSYGITEAQLINEFGSLDPNMITLTAEVILETENLIDEGKSISIFENNDYVMANIPLMDNSKEYSENSIVKFMYAGDTFGGCLADAAGITAIFEISKKGFKGIGKRGALKIVGKLGRKYTPYVGLALAAYDFGDCMGWI